MSSIFVRRAMTSMRSGFSSVRAFSQAADTRPSVYFVLGPPGAGKGTNCDLLVKNYGFYHISAGDCLREERTNPDSKDGELINNYIKEGQIVPVGITIKLMLSKMEQQQARGKSKFLIDGFPRNADNKKGWNTGVGDKVRLEGVLFYSTTEDEVKKRILERGKTSGRVDDNIESLVKRVKTYNEETCPVIEEFKKEGVPVHSIDATPSMEIVWAATEVAVHAVYTN